MANPSGGRLAMLSRRATLRAAALTRWVPAQELPPTGLAAVLYRAGGCAPKRGTDPQWPQLLLRRAETGVRQRLTGYQWAATEGWASWTAAEAHVADLVHKVYVSPAVTGLARALPVVFESATARRVPAWKVGSDLPSVHRPDKIVLYLGDADEADRAAAALADALATLPAQGVPFTWQVGDSGIVSRGLDRDATSWRAVVCQLLSDALWQARDELGDGAPDREVGRAALERLAEAGFDVDDWSPRAPATSTVP